jgi:hypothetical protein
MTDDVVWTHGKYTFSADATVCVDGFPIAENPCFKERNAIVFSNAADVCNFVAEVTGAAVTNAAIHWVKGSSAGGSFKKVFAFVTLTSASEKTRLVSKGDYEVRRDGWSWKLRIRAPSHGPTTSSEFVTLEDLAILSETTQTSDDPTEARVRSTPKHRWEFKSKQGSWWPMEGQRSLEDAVAKGEREITIGTHRIDFRLLTQQNTVTKTTRAIRRVLQQLPSKTFVWECEGVGNASWEPSALSEQLETAYLTGESSINVGIFRVANLTQGVLKNRITGKERNLRRREIPLSWRDPTTQDRPKVAESLGKLCGTAVSEVIFIPWLTGAQAVPLDLGRVEKAIESLHAVKVIHSEPDGNQYLVVAKCNDDVPRCGHGHPLEVHVIDQAASGQDQTFAARVSCSVRNCPEGILLAKKEDTSKEYAALMQYYRRENLLVSEILQLSEVFPFLKLALSPQPPSLGVSPTAQRLATTCVWVLLRTSSMVHSIYGGVIRDLLRGKLPADIDVAVNPSARSATLESLTGTLQQHFDRYFPNIFSVTLSGKKRGVMGIWVVRHIGARAKEWSVTVELVDTLMHPAVVDMSFNNLEVGAKPSASGASGMFELRQKHPGQGGGLLGCVLSALTKVGTVTKPSNDSYQVTRRADKAQASKGYRLLNVDADYHILGDLFDQIVRNKVMVLDATWIGSIVQGTF